jgi:hypothetical protein
MLALLGAALSLGVTLHVGGMATGVPAALLAVAFLPVARTRAGRLVPVLLALSWLALAVMPILDNVVPTRLMVYVVLFASLLVAVSVDRWFGLPVMAAVAPKALTGRSLRSGLIGALAGLVLVVSLLPRVPFPASPVNVPEFFLSRAGIRDGEVALVVPVARNFESRAMLWQAGSGMQFRMPEGYANRPGPSLDPPHAALTEALIEIQEGRPAPAVSPAFRSAALSDLRRWSAAAVVVGPMERQERVVAFLSDLLGSSPSHERGVLVWHLEHRWG